MFQITTKCLSSELDLPASMPFIMLSGKVFDYILNRSESLQSEHYNITFYQGVDLDNVNVDKALLK